MTRELTSMPDVDIAASNDYNMRISQRSDMKQNGNLFGRRSRMHLYRFFIANL